MIYVRKENNMNKKTIITIILSVVLIASVYYVINNMIIPFFNQNSDIGYLKHDDMDAYIEGEVSYQELLMELNEKRKLSLDGNGKFTMWYSETNPGIVEIKDDKKELEQNKKYEIFAKKTFKIEAKKLGTTEITMNWQGEKENINQVTIKIKVDKVKQNR